MSKYHNKKVTVDGIQFDSIREAQRYGELKLMEKTGLITHLKLQVPFEVLPAYRDKITGKVIERAVTYRADFAYHDAAGRLVVEDAKGKRTPDYIIKRKLMRWKGIPIVEV